MTPAEIYEEFVAGFPHRKFSAGLLVAFIDFYVDLGIPGSKIRSLNDLFRVFPKQDKTSAGKTANTLIVVRKDGSRVSLRPFYNAAEDFFRVENKRFDYPSCAPHATQVWIDYKHWLDSLTGLSANELLALRKKVVGFLLGKLKSHEFDPGTVAVDPPLFRLFLQGFDLTAQRGELSGAAFQGTVFGFLRADNPHLQIEIDKVRTGSKRLQRIADIDGWNGAHLAISAEVKQYRFGLDNVAEVEGFANQTTKRGAIGIVAALEFDGEARTAVEKLGLQAIDVAEMKKIVQLWDPLKQRTAVASLVYYAHHVEKNSFLADRIDTFLNTLTKPAAVSPS